MMKRLGVLLAALLWASCAFGQANNSNTWQTPGNQTVGGSVQMSVTGSQALPLSPNVDTGALVTLTTASTGGNSADQTNNNGRGVSLAVNISAISGTGATLTITVQGKDPVSGNYYNIFAAGGLTTTGTTAIQVYPGITTATNAGSAVLPRTWRVLYAITGTTPSVTATISASVIL